ncbi:MAG: hypothetical protein AB2A00_19425 [Myxococcota bacterium]
MRIPWRVSVCSVVITSACLHACSSAPSGSKSAQPPAGLARALLASVTWTDGTPANELNDRDTRTGATISQGAVLNIELPHSRDVRVVKVHATGNAVARVVLQDSQGGVVEELEPAPLGEGAWSRVGLVERENRTASLRLELDPGSAGATVTEVDVFVVGTPVTWINQERLPGAIQEGDPTALVVRADPDHAELVPGGSGDQDDAPATCATLNFTVPVNPRSLQRVVLTYEARGLAGPFSLVRSINGLGRAGGLVLPATSDTLPYSERIPPELLVAGANALELCGPPVGTYRVRIQSARIVLEGERSPVAEPGEDSAGDPLGDGDEMTGQALDGGGSVLTYLLTRPTSLDGVLVRHDGVLDVERIRLSLDGVKAAVVHRLPLAGGDALILSPHIAQRTVQLDFGAQGGRVSDVFVLGSGLSTPTPP